MPKTFVIIGGVAGGASAAARLRRLDESAEIVLVERGEHISFANCGLPYAISGEIEDRADLLVQTPQSMRKRFRIQVLTSTEAISIQPQAQKIMLKDLATGEAFEQPYDGLILSPGAAPVRLAIPGVDLPGVHTLRNMADMDAIKARAEANPGGRAVILGGGYIGLEMAEALKRRGMQVSLVELGAQVMGPADPEMAAYLSLELKSQGVNIRLKTSITGIRAEKDGSLLIDLSDNTVLPADLLLMAPGVRPEVSLAKQAGLVLGPKGGILVDEHMCSSDPHIYAVGDAVEVKDLISGNQSLIPLAGPANRQGRIAADHLCGLDSSYKGTQGTAIVRVFSQVFAMTGASEKALRAAGRAYEKIYLHPNQHAGYFPSAKSLRIKLLFDPADGKILGAQILGEEGVDKRIDVFAVALRTGLTVYDLEELELAYAPPFGSAKDPVNFAGFVAANVLEGKMRIFHSDLASHPGPDQQLVDVRTAAEFKEGAIPGALNFPVDSLREHLDELPKDKELLVYCKVGLRGYLACRILTQRGIRCQNLSGGYLSWQAYEEAAA